MRLHTLVRRSLRFYWRTHLGILLGAAVATAVLVGALLVGDSVAYSLRRTALSRIGSTHYAIVPQGRTFGTRLATEIEKALDLPAGSMLMLRGVAVRSDQSARVNRVEVLGVSENFWRLAASDRRWIFPDSPGIFLNRRLAERLKAVPGDEILLRIEKLESMPREAPLGSVADTSVVLRLPVIGLLGSEAFGDFSLQANQVPPLNAFVPLDYLQEKLGLTGRVNTLLLGGKGTMPSLEEANEALRSHWSYEDAELSIRDLPGSASIELNSRRVFLDPPVVDALLDMGKPMVGVFTYFVNELRVGGRTTPYSMVTAVGELGDSSRLLPASLHVPENRIAINAWLAEDLHAEVGDTLTLRYYMVEPGRKLHEVERAFPVHAILPMDGSVASPDWMPDFPGLSDVENCRAWEPGIPIDLDRIRPKDESYWDDYRGTPKAFLNLSTGQQLWANRYGNLTALRFSQDRVTHQELAAAIREGVDPARLGLFFQPVRERVLTASTQALDFGELFLSLSFFLIAAALLLLGMLFAFAVEQRLPEITLLRSVGLPAGLVRRWLLMEGGGLALLGAILGTLLGIGYTRVVLAALTGVWRGAVAESALWFHAEPTTWLVGPATGILLALLVMWIRLAATRGRRRTTSSRRQMRQPTTRQPTTLWIGGGLILAAVALVGVALVTGRLAVTAIFFSSGGLLLIGGILWVHGLLTRWERSAGRTPLTLPSLGRRNAVRWRGRSTATVALLACGCFLVVAVGANRQDPLRHSTERHAGTGGFALYAETSLPLIGDSEATPPFGLSDERLDGLRLVPMRVHAGDDASCLNLNRAQTPRLLGVNPEALDSRGAFTLARSLEGLPEGRSWQLLRHRFKDGALPAIVDQTTATWALGKSLGDTMLYQDERGNELKLRFVGLLANSILQGNLIIGEEPFLEHFPSESGYRVLLVDAPPSRTDEVATALTRALRGVGAEVQTTVDRLAQFNVVQNTYLSIFQALGGLGLLVGSIGLGIVVLRNVLERRHELALLRAVGFSVRQLNRMLLSEHTMLLAFGVGGGVIAAVVAVLPAIASPGVQIPYRSLILTLGGIVANGLGWIWLATRAATRGDLLDPLRNE